MAARGLVRRAVWIGGVAVALTGLAACDPFDSTNSMVVTTIVDGGDADPGDGVCEMTAGAEDCSLRAAVDEANANALMALVTVPAGVYSLIDAPGAEDDNATGDLDIDPASGHLVISAPDRGVVIDAAGATGGVDARSGIVVTAGVSVTESNGTAFVARSGAALSVLYSSPYANGGAAVTFEAGSTGQVLSSTLGTNGAGLVNDGDVFVRYVTITANGGAGVAGSGTTTMTSSIIVNQNAGPDCASPVTSAGWNAFGEASCGVAADDTLTTDLALTLAFDHGVPVFVPGNRAFDVRDAIPLGHGACIAGANEGVDQAGVPRPVGAACDKGSFESEAPPIDLVVDAPHDANDADPADGVCDDGTGACTLRAATQEANAQGGATADHFDPVTISIAPGVTPLVTLPPTDPGSFSTAEPFLIAGGVTIEGNGATIDLNDRDGQIQVAHQYLRLNDLSIVNADFPFPAELHNLVPGGSGASIALDHVVTDNGYGGLDVIGMSGGALSIIDSRIGSSYGYGVKGTMDSVLVERSILEGTDQPLSVTAPDVVIRDTSIAGGGLGSGVNAGPDGHVTIERTTIAFTPGFGVAGNLTMRDSTYTQNRSAPFRLWGSGSISSSTFADNAYGTNQDFTGDLSVSGGTATVSASILGGSSGSVGGDVDYPSCSIGAGGSIISGGYNIGVDKTCGLTATGDQQGVLLFLATAGDNGGPTRTVLPLPASPAVDRIPIGTAGLCDVTTPTDQRGVARPQGPACDAGAVETTAPPSVQLVVDTATDANDADPSDGLCDDGTGACPLRAAIQEANAQGGADAAGFVPATITIAPGIDPVISLPSSDPSGGHSSDPLLVAGGLTIEGNGQTLDLAGTDRHLQVLHHYLRIHDLHIADSDTTAAPMIDTDVAGATGPAILLDEVDLAGVGSDGVRLQGGRLLVTDSTITGVGMTGTALVGSMDEVRLDRTAIRDADIAMTVDAATITVRDTEIVSGYGATLTGGTVRILRSTFQYLEGGLQVAGNVEMRESTYTNNEGGVFLEAGSLFIGASTLTDNWFYSGTPSELNSDILIGAGRVSIKGNVIGGVGYPSCRFIPGATGTLDSYGYNVATDATCELTGTADAPGVALRLGPLADNGGPTRTRMPLVGSPAIDRIPVGSADTCDSPPPRVDQRGVARPQGPACDSGSVEQ